MVGVQLEQMRMKEVGAAHVKLWIGRWRIAGRRNVFFFLFLFFVFKVQRKGVELTQLHTITFLW